LGRTYVIGNDSIKHKLKSDIEKAWYETKEWFHKQTKLTGAELYQYAVEKAKEYGWTFGGEIAGHLIGEFPHERLEPGNYQLYVHPTIIMICFYPMQMVIKGMDLEIHFIDTKTDRWFF
jgi:hypothetical protein